MQLTQIHTLKNNIRVAYAPSLSDETSAVGVWINTGARYEPKPVKGIAHYLEHLLFKGTKKYSYKRLKQEIEGRGGILNGFTSQEMTCYYAKVLNKNILKTLDILLDMVSVPVLKDDDIQKERQVILEEVKMQNDLPQSRSEMIIDELLWGDSPLGCDVIGTVETIRKTTQEDMRLFLRRQYVPSRILITVCSKASLKHIQRSIEHKCSGWKAHDETLFSLVPSSLQSGVALRCEEKDLQQTHMVVGFKGLKRADPGMWALKLLHVILGANMSSRLFEKIREEYGLAYDVATAYRSFHDSGCFSIHTALAPENIKKTVELILAELRRLKRTVVAHEEYQRGKDYLLGQHIMAFERNMDYMLFMGESLLGLGYVPSLTEIKQRIKDVSVRDVQKMARYIFCPDLIKISLVGKVRGTIKKDIGSILKEVDHHV